MSYLKDPDVIWGIIAIIGVATMVLNRLGMIKFGKKNNGNRCPEPAFKEKVEQSIKKVDILERKMDEAIFPKINQTAEDVSYIRGWIEAQE